MKITKRQLRRIIKEEKQKLLKEQFGSMVETGSALIDFAEAYSGLGNAVQEQFSAIATAYSWIMKISKRQLKRIIREEKEQLLDEVEVDVELLRLGIIRGPE